MECNKTNCWCHLEWFCEHAGLARVFGGDQKFGDSYCYALPFVIREKYDTPQDGILGLIEFVGVLKVMKPCQYRAMRKAIRDINFGILSTRVKNGEKRTIRICKRNTD